MPGACDDNAMTPNDSGAQGDNLVGLLRRRARQDPDRLAYRFGTDDDSPHAALTYAQLDRRAQEIADAVRRSQPAGSHALLLFARSRDFVEAFFGCLYAGLVAVPAAVPRRANTVQRLEIIAADAEAKLILSSSDTWDGPLRPSLTESALSAVPSVLTDRLSAASGPGWLEPALTSGSPALLQYTSGSTGNPKGVMVTHGNILDNVGHLVARSNLDMTSIGVSWLPLFHDMGLMGGVIAPLFAKFPVTLLSPAAFLSQPMIWLQTMTRYRATVSVAPNFGYELCLAKVQPEHLAELDLSAWNVAFCGGEPVRPDTLQRFAETFAACGFRRSTFFPCYGLAEATLIVAGGPKSIAATALQVDDGALRTGLAAESQYGKPTRNLMSCGRPVPEDAVVVVDPATRAVCADRHVGEIWVHSRSVGRGYWKHPDETRQVFGARLADPDQRRFLRTGDLGFLDRGCLYIAGRIKDLIIIRGLNHHPQNIELTVEKSHQALQSHSGAAFSIDDGGEERLVIVQEIARSWRGGTSAIVDAIRRNVARDHGLAAHAIALVKQGTILRTTSGKIQRSQIRAAFEAGRLAAVATWVAGKDAAGGVDIEEGSERFTGTSSHGAADGGDERIALAQSVIVRELARLLEVPEAVVQLHAPLSSFALDSLRIFQLQAAMAAALNVRVDTFHFFEDHSIAELAAIAVERSKSCAIPLLTPRPQDAVALPLSFVQERLWFLDQLQPGEPAYNNAAVVRLTGQLSVGALESSLGKVIARHESLRTRFVSRNGSPFQEVDDAAGFRLDVVDLSGLPESERRAELDRWRARETATYFVLSAGRLFRARLLRLAAHEHVLLLTMHHIISDAWSLKILIRELTELYGTFAAGRRPQLSPLAVQYADYALWQRQWLLGSALERELSYWKKQLSEAPVVLELPADRIRPAVQKFTAAVREQALSRQLTNALVRFARAEGVTLFMALLATFQALLARWSGQEDIVVGTPVAGRSHPLIEPLIGFFVNILALRTDLGGDLSFRELLQRVKKVAVAGYACQDTPFEKVIELVSPDRTLSHGPIFQVAINMLEADEQVVKTAGVKMEITSQTTFSSKFDMTLYVREAQKRVVLQLVYNATLFGRDRMSEFLTQFADLLAQALKCPDEKLSNFSLVTRNAKRFLPDPRRPLSDRWHGAVHQIFSRQAARQPDAIAIVEDAASWSYREVDDISSRVGAYLRANGVGRGDTVAILGHRSAPLVWAILGALKAGAAFTILDPAYPAARLIAYIGAVRPRAWLEVAASQEQFAPVLEFVRDLGCCRVELRRAALLSPHDSIAGPSTRDADAVVGPDDPAVITFTSGSTGKPKAIVGRHGPLSHFIPWQRSRFGFSRLDRFSMMSGISHDPIQRDIFTPLCLGAAICIPCGDEANIPAAMAAWMCRSGVTVAHLTPGLAQLLSSAEMNGGNAPAPIASLRYAFVVGDVLTKRDIAALRAVAPSVTCVNYYGSTETQRSVGYYVVPQEYGDATSGEDDRGKEILPLGQGINDVQLLVLNRRQRLAGVGELGEIYMRSHHMAAGYLGDDVLTAERFLANPYTETPGDRLYRTGDLGRYLPDGNVEFAGRVDRQVKNRGHRIELGEIEAVLLSMPYVRDAVVIVRQDTAQQKILAAYLVLARDAMPPVFKHLREQLLRILPDYMVPSAFITLESLPLTPNGKIDYDRLPRPERPLSGVPARLANDTERALAGIWAELMNLQQVGRHDNFFELGGHSLLASQVMSRVRQLFDCELPVRTLFEAPTLSELSARIEAKQKETTSRRILQTAAQ
jgi:amino acid adenylation domain-containing protein